MKKEEKEKKNPLLDSKENKYLSVLVSSRRARQLLDRAEKHSLAVDTEKVVQQALKEFNGDKIAYEFSEVVPPKKKQKEKD